MRIPRVFQSGDYIQGSIILLDPEAFQHVVKVLRLQPGDALLIFDGKGRIFDSTIAAIEKKTCHVSLNTQQIETAPQFKLTLAQAIIKPDKMDLIIQKAVELGVTTIVPLISQFCDIKLNPELLQKKRLHWQKIIVAACEQSGVNYLPELLPAQLFNDWIDTEKTPLSIILDPYAEKRFSQLPKDLTQLTKTIGPEGGFSEMELKQAVDHGFVDLSLGKRILRAETAAIASLAICQFQWNV